MTTHPLEAAAGSARSAPVGSQPFGPPHRYVDVGKARLATWRIGPGPDVGLGTLASRDVVLLHGWPLHSATFRRIVPALSRDHTLHLLDLPGAGASEWDRDAPLDLPSTARALRRAIDALGLSRYALLAHDSGGLVARLVAAEDARVTGLVLGNTEIPGHTPWLVKLYAALVHLPGAGRLLLRGMGVGSIRRSFLGFGGCFEDPAWVDGEFGDLFVKPLVAGGKAAAGALGMLETLDARLLELLAAAHGRIRAPVRLIWGAEDRFFPLDGARAMLPTFAGGAELVVIPRAKLFAHEDHAEEFAAHAAAALRSFDGRLAEPASTDRVAASSPLAVLDG